MTRSLIITQVAFMFMIFFVCVCVYVVHEGGTHSTSNLQFGCSAL